MGVGPGEKLVSKSGNKEEKNVRDDMYNLLKRIQQH